MASGSKIKGFKRWRDAKASKAAARNPKYTVLADGTKIVRY